MKPIMAIASSDYDVSSKSLLINLFQLLGLFSWLYLLSDAFDISDTQQSFVYWSRVLGKPGRLGGALFLRAARTTLLR